MCQQTLVDIFVKYYSIFIFFHWHTSQKRCDETTIKDPTTPKSHRYTTWQNINFQKLHQPKHSNGRARVEEIVIKD